MNHMTPAALRKAAVLVCSLDPASADELLEQMGEPLAARVRAAVLDLGPVDDSEQRAVIGEFLAGPGSARNDASLPCSPAQRDDPPRAAGSPPAARQPRFDAAATPAARQPFLPGEPARSGRPRVAPRHEAPRGEARRSETPHREARRPLCLFTELSGLNDESLGTVLEAADPQVVLLALAGASLELVGRVLRPLPPREARALQQRMEQIGPLRLADVEGAQQRLVHVARRLLAAGQIAPPAPHTPHWG